MTNCIMRFATRADWLFSTAFDLPASVMQLLDDGMQASSNEPSSAGRTYTPRQPFCACGLSPAHSQASRYAMTRTTGMLVGDVSAEVREVGRWKREGREDAVADLGMICRGAPASRWTTPTSSEQYTVTQRTLPRSHQPQSINRLSQTSFGERN